MRWWLGLTLGVGLDWVVELEGVELEGIGLEGIERELGWIGGLVT